MAKSRKINISTYLSLNFTKSFLTIFLPLFFIGSLVFIIKISSLTASIQVSFWEMIQLFSYNLPAILFYTLPISFLVAIAITLLRLSYDNELMALFALGSKANTLMYRFSFIATLFTMILLLLSLGLMPQTKQQFKAFKIEKSTQAQVNIKPSKLGQKFGNLFVYVESKERDSLNNIVIYNKDEKHSDQIFIAENANIKNINSVVTLTLNRGSGYTYSEDSLKEINYRKMQIFQTLKSKSFTYESIINYWSLILLNPKKIGRILFFIYVSAIPIILLYLIASFSIINPRYQKNYAYGILIVATISVYVVASLLEKHGTFLTLALALISTFSLGFILFKRQVERFF